MSFSVLMAVYKKDNFLYLDECLKSLADQSLQSSEIIIVEDGEVTEQIANVIEKYSHSLPIKLVKLNNNLGLAAALNAGLAHCSYELIARMDADDISLPQRFEKQVGFMLSNPEISVASAWIEERDSIMSDCGFLKILPTNHVDILAFSKRRNPISHPVSIFRRDAVLSVGGYPLIFPEDYALWSLMLVNNYKFANLPEVLLYMRTGDDFIARRGSKFFKGEIGLLKYQKSINFISLTDFFINFLIRAFIRIPPPKFRKFFYKFARNSYK
ncbi:glycosyltransferase [Glaciimonas sp. GG7]